MTRLAAGQAAAASGSGIRLDRISLFFWLFLIAAANALPGPVLRSVEEAGWLQASFDLFGISAIVWIALLAGFVILYEDREAARMRPCDIAAAAIVLPIAFLPLAPASAVSLTGLALYAIWTSRPGSPLRRAAIVFLAVTGTLIWGRLLLGLFSRPLLNVDAFLVAHVVGTHNQGNLLFFADGSGKFVVAPGCSSLQGMSLATVFWAAVNQWFRVPFSGVSLIWLAFALAATVAINVLRLGALAHFPQHFEAIHTGIGWHVASWTTLAAIVAICVYGARREIFAQD